MIYRTSSKIIAAVLTAALALSPVFVAPISASDGQEVETEASSWRYQDGDIIVDEDVNPFEADDNSEVLEDYNAQMGSSIEEEQAAEPVVEPAEEATAEQAAEPATEPAAEEAAEQPAETEGEPVEEPAEQEAAIPVENGDGLTAEGAEMPEVTAEAPAEQPVQAAEQPAQAAEQPAQAAEQPAQVAEQPAQAEQAAEPELSAKASAMNRYWTWNSGKTKRGPGYQKGIDVSYWQGSINWKKVKAAGVDFAILRCGYGPNKSSKDDTKFAANVKGCKANGIPYGVYLYSYANTVSEAKDEADHAIRLLKANNCQIQYPVYYDLEDSQVAKASNATIRKMANAFCSKLRNSGYASGVYANLNWWNNKLSGFNGYDRWVAQWSSKCTYGGVYSVWQCTSSTHVNGISGRVDANLLMCTKASMDRYMKTYSLAQPVSYSIKVINGKEYGVDSKGNLIKNRFVSIGSYIYGFGSDGIKLKGKKYWLGNVAYTLDSQGRAYIHKSKTKKKTPYYAKAGSGKKGTLKKGKKFYVLRTSGKWSQMANGYWVKTKNTKKVAVYPSIKPSKTVKYKAKLKKKTVSRSGPSTRYIKKKTFKKNKTVTVIGTYGSWSKISSGQWLPSGKLKK